MKKKAFTLVEIMIALIIVSVVVSLSIVTFQKTIEANNDRICRQNLKVLQGAFEIYAIENNALPTTLSLLTPEQIHLAYEKVIAKPKENRIAGYFNNLIGIKPLFADLGKYYGNDPKVLRCPADKITTTGDSSYTQNMAFTTKDDLEEYPDTVLLSDSDYYHKKDILFGETYQIGISPSGKYGTKNRQGVVEGPISFPTATDSDEPSSCTTIGECCPKPTGVACKKNCKNAGFKWNHSTHECEDDD